MNKRSKVFFNDPLVKVPATALLPFGGISVKRRYKIAALLAVSLNISPRPCNLVVAMKSTDIPSVRLELKLLGVLHEGVKVLGAVLVLFLCNHILTDLSRDRKSLKKSQCLLRRKVAAGIG